jgi:hypothetical protein
MTPRPGTMRLACMFSSILLFGAAGLLLFISLQDPTELAPQQVPGEPPPPLSHPRPRPHGWPDVLGQGDEPLNRQRSSGLHSHGAAPLGDDGEAAHLLGRLLPSVKFYHPLGPPPNCLGRQRVNTIFLDAQVRLSFPAWPWTPLNLHCGLNRNDQGTL